MRKRRKMEEHDNPDRWVISYADFITLLFAFFTTLYAISNVDSSKLKMFAGSMKSALKATGTNSSAGTTIIEGIKPISYADVKLEKDIRKTFEKFGKLEGISISRDQRGVLISFGDSVLFDTGSAVIKDEAEPLLSSVISVIKRAQNNIIVEGHTDNIPIKSKYLSNWELSTARAAGVLMYILKENNNMSPERFSTSGYAEYRPVTSNVTPEGRAKNRRVDIVFVSNRYGS
ncbi:MAG: OmpA family protein [Desulfobacterales bacterium]|nr:OmpA family protein [Desulfobacterales bacterium]